MRKPLSIDDLHRLVEEREAIAKEADRINKRPPIPCSCGNKDDCCGVCHIITCMCNTRNPKARISADGKFLHITLDIPLDAIEALSRGKYWDKKKYSKDEDYRTMRGE